MIKIGKAKDLRVRIDQYQLYYPFGVAVELLWIFPKATRNVDSKLHQMERFIQKQLDPVHTTAFTLAFTISEAWNRAQQGAVQACSSAGISSAGSSSGSGMRVSGKRWVLPAYSDQANVFVVRTELEFHPGAKARVEG